MIEGPYTLVDPPVTPYSSAADIRAWLDHCRAQAAAHADDAGWRSAVDAAARMLASVEQGAAE